ncbi:MAG: rRNA pseudouridine synthase [Spirochaetes bacterium]|nr:rRNA pseudouridine synthase [Spirochaetota bacterium]
MSKKIRINKYLTLCGLGSRRKVEEYIRNNKIKVNGELIKSLSYIVDADNDKLEFNNKTLSCIEKKYFIILNKPKGYITSLKDEHERPTVMDLIPDRFKKAMINPVGRLDKDSEGLLLFTNDGETAYRLTHPKFKIKKEYIVELNDPLKEEDKIKIEKGVFIYGERTNPAMLACIDSSKKIIKMTISEGKKRHIRLTFDIFSYKVKKLKRVAFGPIRLKNLYSGSYRLLREDEIKKLRRAVDL